MKLLVITRKVDRNDALAGFTYGWIQEFSKHVESLNVICLEKGDISGLPEHVHIYSLGKEKGKNRLREFMRFHYFAFHLVRKVDGVFAHQNPEYGILIAPWTKLYGKKLIAWYTHKAVTWKVRLLEKLSDHIVTASKESFRLASSKTVILQHGVDTNYFSLRENYADTKMFSFLTVGRLSPTKKVELIVDAYLQADLPNAQLDIVGDTHLPLERQYKAGLMERVRRSGLSDRIHFHGWVPHHELRKYYQSSNVFINVSDTGSLDKSVLEAMASGCLVITSNEAFKSIIFDPWFLSRTSVPEIGEVLRRAYYLSTDARRGIGVRLRDIVVTQHALSRCIERIVALFTHGNNATQ